MGEVTRASILATLVRDNPRAKLSIVSLYADAFAAYREAALNIATYGSIVQHPRTGQPMANPYLPIQNSARLQLAKLHLARTDSLWAALSLELAQVAASPSDCPKNPTPP